MIVNLTTLLSLCFPKQPKFLDLTTNFHIHHLRLSELTFGWKDGGKRRRTMTCLLHIRTTTAASPNTKRKERSEDLWILEEQNTLVILQSAFNVTNNQIPPSCPKHKKSNGPIWHLLVLINTYLHSTNSTIEWNQLGHIFSTKSLLAHCISSTCVC